MCSLADNFPVAIDLTVFQECLPRRWGWLLTLLACVWGLGNAITGFIGTTIVLRFQNLVNHITAWPLMVYFACPAAATPETCKKSDNMGWRYLYIILGGLCLIMSIIRTLAVSMHESPKWLVTRGELVKAVEALNAISRVNKSDFTLSVHHLSQLEDEQKSERAMESVAKFFDSRKLVRSTLCLILLWMMIGIAYVSCCNTKLYTDGELGIQYTPCTCLTTLKLTAPN